VPARCAGCGAARSAAAVAGACILPQKAPAPNLRKARRLPALAGSRPESRAPPPAAANAR
jgi:hypothetical protein